jgi:hypothetical protein
MNRSLENGLLAAHRGVTRQRRKPPQQGASKRSKVRWWQLLERSWRRNSLRPSRSILQRSGSRMDFSDPRAPGPLLACRIPISFFIRLPSCGLQDSRVQTSRSSRSTNNHLHSPPPSSYACTFDSDPTPARTPPYPSIHNDPVC